MLAFQNLLDDSLQEVRNNPIKALIAVAMISFGGFCIHTQVYSILSETKISYKNYFFSRILHVIIATTILTLFFILL